MVPSVPENLSDQDRENEKIKKIFNEIVSAAKIGEFQRAEALRDKLIEEAPTALKEIIGSADIIEEEKAKGIDTRHLAIWDKLYSGLSQDERNSLFYSMKKIVVPPKKIILSHGAYNTKLFLIDSGKVTIFFPKKGKNTVLAQLGQGSLLGEYSFTSISLCSATAVSFTNVELYCLENAATDFWHDKHPGLYEKVVDFCIEHGSIEDISRWKTLEKRSRPRYPVTGPVRSILLAKDGTQTETYFRGSLTDISLEGCAFEIKLSKKATARALLGRSILLKFDFDIGEGVAFDVVGKIVKVTFFIQNEYCIHVKFNKPLGKALLHDVISNR